MMDNIDKYIACVLKQKITGKIKEEEFLIQVDVLSRYNNWLTNGGKEKFEKEYPFLLN